MYLYCSVATQKEECDRMRRLKKEKRIAAALRAPITMSPCYVGAVQLLPLQLLIRRIPSPLPQHPRHALLRLAGPAVVVVYFLSNPQNGSPILCESPINHGNPYHY